MTLQEAYRVLRRYEDFRTGFDQRCVCDAFPSREHREAIQLILASQGLDNPITDCECCQRYAGDDQPVACKLHVKGECAKFEEVKE